MLAWALCESQVLDSEDEVEAHGRRQSRFQVLAREKRAFSQLAQRTSKHLHRGA